MEPKGPLPHSQQQATCPYPEPDQSTPRPHPTSTRSHLNIILPSTPGSSKWFLSSDFLTKTLYATLTNIHISRFSPIQHFSETNSHLIPNLLNPPPLGIPVCWNVILCRWEICWRRSENTALYPFSKVKRKRVSFSLFAEISHTFPFVFDSLSDPFLVLTYIPLR
jgi:hypothetical protein